MPDRCSPPLELPSCWILTTPRTGSTMLCNLLREAGLDLREWFNYSPTYGTETWDRSDAVPKYCKVFPDQFEHHYGHGRFEMIEEQLPYIKWIYLRRNDLAEQTASFLLSKRSDVWNHGSRNRHKAARLAATPADFSEDEVRSTAGWLKSMDRQLWEFIRVRPHLAISYELLHHQLKRTLDEVFSYIGLAVNPASFVVSTVKLTHPGKEELIACIRRLLD